MAQQISAELVIVGAGVVGSALALAIAMKHPTLKIALIDPEGLRAPSNPPEDSYDPRVVALNHQSVNYLEDLGVWPAVVSARVCEYRKMCVWDGEGTARIHFGAADLHRERLGVIVENNLLVAALHERLRHFAGLVVVPAALQGLTPQADGYRLELSNGRQVDARLTVGADGARSQVRELTGFRTRQWPYDQSAIVTSVKSTQPHCDTAWQRFTDFGPLAFLPLAGNDSRYCSIVWSLAAERIPEIIALEDEAFCDILGREFEHTLGKVVWCDKRYEVPLRQMHVTHYYQAGLALVGDAAHTVHPLAGQGVNLGLRDAAVLAEELERAVNRRLPLSEAATLRRYQRRVQAYNLGAMTVMEAFNWIYTQPQPHWRVLRNFGLANMDRMLPLKRELMRVAAGDRFQR